ncbi:MAG: Uma2 family endonuclease [Planctomycetota bacterium]
MSTAEQPYLAPSDYLDLERTSLNTKHEYHAGEMFSMAGASYAHNLIGTNLSRFFGNALADTQCVVLASDMRVKVDPTGLYTYPDLVIACEKPTFEDEHVDTLLNPQVIIEVLSDSTESYDRGKKFEHYRQIESLREYLLVSQDHAHVDRFVRGDDGDWRLTDATGLNASITVATIDVPLPLAEVYAKVDLPPATDAG